MTTKEGKLIYLMKNNSSFVLFYILQVIDCCFFLSNEGFLPGTSPCIMCVSFPASSFFLNYGWMSCARPVRAKKIKSNL